jgi:hypothetical protein
MPRIATPIVRVSKASGIEAAKRTPIPVIGTEDTQRTCPGRTPCTTIDRRSDIKCAPQPALTM